MERTVYDELIKNGEELGLEINKSQYLVENLLRLKELKRGNDMATKVLEVYASNGMEIPQEVANMLKNSLELGLDDVENDKWTIFLIGLNNGIVKKSKQAE